MFERTKSLESDKEKVDLKIISSGYSKNFIVIGTGWDKKDMKDILNSGSN